MTSIEVREARPEDAARIAAVARASWSDTYRDIFSEEHIDRFVAEHYAPAMLATQAANAAASEDGHFLVAERGGAIVGYAQFGVGARGPELSRIYADPSHYGTGVGVALLAELHRRLEGRVDAYVLDVHSRNARGRDFYDRNGFVIVGGGATPDCDLTLQRTLAPPRPTLPVRTERLRLRSLEDTDADAKALHAIYGDAETMRYIGARGRPAPDLEATRRILRHLVRHETLHGFSLWGVEERGADGLVGVAGLVWVEDHGPEVEAAYLVRRDRWGRGYATEALRTVLDVAHDELGLPRVVALAYREHDASRHVMEKAGMRPDGTVAAYDHELTRHVSERPGRVSDGPTPSSPRPGGA
jgi:ribosomal-protein-alanine N-acetyltransferase